MKQQNQEPLNLITTTSNYIERTISASAKDMFLNDPIIKMAQALPPEIQRIVINKFFYNKLLVWRNHSNTPVFNIIAMLCDDGDIENWFKLFGLYVVPFLRDNCVLGLPSLDNIKPSQG